MNIELNVIETGTIVVALDRYVKQHECIVNNEASRCVSKSL